MLRKEDLSTRVFVAENKGMFEDVARAYDRSRPAGTHVFSILNYEKFIDEMCQFITGYLEYKDKGDDKYSGKVLGTTLHFYNSMFDDVREYRKNISLAEMKYINQGFLSGTKALQTLISDNLERSKKDEDLEQLLLMTDNQYRKLSKVYRDDMQIYRWLATSDLKKKQYQIPVDLRIAFNDKKTPVMHQVK